MSVVFDRAATFYDRTRGLPVEAEREMVEAVGNAGLSPGSRVLEIGVGTGRIALPLARVGYRYTGVDLSAEMMRALRAKPGARRIDLARADAARLPFHARVFDAVIAVHVFHLIGDWTAAMDELRRVLRPDGMLLHGSNRHDEGDGPRELRRRLDELADDAGWRRASGLADWSEIEPRLAERFGQARLVETPSWTRATTPREVIEQLRERIWSHTWGLSDAQLAAAADQAADWAIERWGSLDAPLTHQQHFRWEIYSSDE